MKIAFYTSNCIPFTDSTVDHRPVGGTESGAIYVSRCLRDLGARVTLYTADPEGGEFNGITYKPTPQLQIDAQTTTFDIFVAIRDWIPLLMPVQSQGKYFWTGDSYDQFYNYGIGDKRFYTAVDSIITVSRWQAQALAEHADAPIDRFYASRNGYWPAYFETPPPRKKNKLIYTSTPHRGLDVLLTLFPKIRARYPDAELHLFSSLQVYGKGTLKESFPDIERLIHQPGVVSHESVLQNQLAQEIQESYLYLYPNHFEETSCICAIEAQAAGTPMISSKRAALAETLEHEKTGLLVEGDPHTSDYQERFLKQVFRLMDSNADWERLSRNGIERAETHYPWMAITKEWVSHFTAQLRKKAETRSTRPQSAS